MRFKPLLLLFPFMLACVTGSSARPNTAEVIGSVVDCTAKNQPQISSLLDELRTLLGGQGSKDAVYQRAKDAGVAIGGCALTELAQEVERTVATGMLGAAPPSPEERNANAALEQFKREVAAGATFHTTKGDR